MQPSPLSNDRTRSSPRERPHVLLSPRSPRSSAAGTTGPRPVSGSACSARLTRAGPSGVWPPHPVVPSAPVVKVHPASVGPPFLLRGWVVSRCMAVPHGLSVHQSTGVRVVSTFLVIMNDAAVNIHVQAPVGSRVQLSRVCPEKGN